MTLAAAVLLLGVFCFSAAGSAVRERENFMGFRGRHGGAVGG